MARRKEFIDINWDDELSPPAWVVRKVEKLPDGSLVVEDADLATNKKHAIRMAREWSKRSGLKLKKVM